MDLQTILPELTLESDPPCSLLSTGGLVGNWGSAGRARISLLKRHRRGWCDGFHGGQRVLK